MQTINRSASTFQNKARALWPGVTFPPDSEIHSFLTNMARRFPERERDDMVAEGWLKLLTILPNYNPEKGVYFMRYALPFIRGCYLQWMRDKAQTIRVPRHVWESGERLTVESLNMYAETLARPSWQEGGRREEVAGRIQQALASLPPQVRLVTTERLYYGSTQEDTAKLARIGKQSIAPLVAEGTAALRAELSDLYR